MARGCQSKIRQFLGPGRPSHQSTKGGLLPSCPSPAAGLPGRPLTNVKKYFGAVKLTIFLKTIAQHVKMQLPPPDYKCCQAPTCRICWKACILVAALWHFGTRDWSLRNVSTHGLPFGSFSEVRSSEVGRSVFRTAASSRLCLLVLQYKIALRPNDWKSDPKGSKTFLPHQEIIWGQLKLIY